MISHQDSLRSIANDLLAAYQSREPIAPPRTVVTDLDITDAYAIQQIQEKDFVARGHKVIGRKVGLTSLAMQRQLGVDSPDFGFFTDADLFEAGAAIPVDRFISPKVEPELAFVLEEDLGPGATLEEARKAVKSAHLAVEIIDSRVRDWDIRLVDTIADNASFGAIVWDPTPVDLDLEQATEVHASMALDGQVVGEGVGKDVMGDPLLPLPWLAGILDEQGTALRAGDIVLTGSFCGAVAFEAGQHLTVSYGPYGTIDVRFN